MRGSDGTNTGSSCVKRRTGLRSFSECDDVDPPRRLRRRVPLRRRARSLGLAFALCDGMHFAI